MPKKSNPKKDLAFELWLKSEKQRPLKDIAEEVGVSASQIYKWKSQDKWDSKVKKNLTRKRGAQKGNQNAKNNRGGSAPKGNQNARTHGFYSKFLPAETLEIINAMPTDPLDILWQQIEISYAAIIRAQHIMYVKDAQDKTTTVTMDGLEATTYDVQQAWEKQANFMQAQARAQGQLSNMIAKYDKMLTERGESVSEEQKLRVEKMRCEIDKIKAETEKVKGGDSVTTEDKVAKLFEKIGAELDE